MNIEVRYEDDEGNDLGSEVWAADGDTAADCHSTAESILGNECRRWMDAKEDQTDE